MTIGALLYIVTTAGVVIFGTREFHAYSNALKARTGAGLLGYDDAYNSRFVLDPGRLWRDAVLTREYRLIARKQADPELERLRRRCAIAFFVIVCWALFGLVLL